MSAQAQPQPRLGARANGHSNKSRESVRERGRERGRDEEDEGTSDGPRGDGWTFSRETRDGMKLWTRRAPRASGARGNIREVYVECEFADVEREEFWNAVCDLARYDEFVPFVSASEILRREGLKTWCHARVSTPVIKDRVYTIVITEHAQREKGASVATWASTEELEPPTPSGSTKMRANCGSWDVRDLPRGKGIRVRYSLISDPGDGVPPWLLERMNQKTVPDVLRAFRARALSGKSRPLPVVPSSNVFVVDVKRAFECVRANARAFARRALDRAAKARDA